MRMSRLVVALMVLVAVAAMVVGCTKPTAPPPTAIPSGGPMPTAGTPGSEATYTYVCPTHADQKSDQPGKCPTCQAYMKADTDEPVEYYCPMHSDVVKSEPGECEQCQGMALPARPAGGPTGASAPPAGGAPDTEPAEPAPADAGATPKTGA